jgi:hypothetical protein
VQSHTLNRRHSYRPSLSYVAPVALPQAYARRRRRALPNIEKQEQGRKGRPEWSATAQHKRRWACRGSCWARLSSILLDISRRVRGGSEMRQLTSWCLSACVSAGPTGRIFVNFLCLGLHKKSCGGTPHSIKIGQQYRTVNTDYLSTFLIVFSRMGKQNHQLGGGFCRRCRVSRERLCYACPPVHMYVYIHAAPTGRICVKFDTGWRLLRKPVEKILMWLIKSDKTTGNFACSEPRWGRYFLYPSRLGRGPI